MFIILHRTFQGDTSDSELWEGISKGGNCCVKMALDKWCVQSTWELEDPIWGSPGNIAWNTQDELIRKKKDEQRMDSASAEWKNPCTS